jgi:hypothetical protein
MTQIKIGVHWVSVSYITYRQSNYPKRTINL